MAKAREKGRKNELRAKKILETAGYEVEIAPKSKGRFAKKCDLFGLWDLIGVDGNSVRFIQVKTNRKVYGVQREQYEFFRCPMSCSKEIWVFYDGSKEPVIEYL